MSPEQWDFFGGGGGKGGICLYLFFFSSVVNFTMQQQAFRLHDAATSVCSLWNKSSYFRQYVNKTHFECGIISKDYYCDCFIYSLRILIFSVLHLISVSAILIASTWLFWLCKSFLHYTQRSCPDTLQTILSFCKSLKFIQFTENN